MHRHRADIALDLDGEPGGSTASAAASKGKRANSRSVFSRNSVMLVVLGLLGLRAFLIVNSALPGGGRGLTPTVCAWSPLPLCRITHRVARGPCFHPPPLRLLPLLL